MIPEIFDLPEKRYYLCSMIKADMKMPIEYDFVREKTLELLIDEIKRKNITGSCAELGVYRGEFARKINGSLSDRTLYLYDTYEGFNDSEVKNDNSINWGTKLEHFKDTSIESVLNHMPAREKCVIRKGFFPETFTEQSERFAFVSIDVDLYDPIKNGLDTFYPLLNKGGYIMIHDYNNLIFEGTAKAVREYCDAYGISVVPIPDIVGSVVITK